MFLRLWIEMCVRLHLHSTCHSLLVLNLCSSSPLAACPPRKHPNLALSPYLPLVLPLYSKLLPAVFHLQSTWKCLNPPPPICASLMYPPLPLMYLSFVEFPPFTSSRQKLWNNLTAPGGFQPDITSLHKKSQTSVSGVNVLWQRSHCNLPCPHVWGGAAHLLSQRILAGEQYRNMSKSVTVLWV